MPDLEDAESNTNIPLVEFVDVDRDGMIDLIFYHEKKIYTYYNMLEHKHKGHSLGSEYLCTPWNETSNGLIFQNWTSDLGEAGNRNVVI